MVILPLLALILMVWKGFVYTIAVYFYAFRLAFCSIHMLTLFYIKTSLRENRLFAAEWTIDEQKRPHNVKYYTEKRTKQDRQM